MNDKFFITANEIAELAEVSIATAYRIIKRLNAELEANGKMVFRGRVVRTYFMERFNCQQA